jgi:hypothetical protein
MKAIASSIPTAHWDDPNNVCNTGYYSFRKDGSLANTSEVAKRNNCELTFESPVIFYGISTDVNDNYCPTVDADSPVPTQNPVLAEKRVQVYPNKGVPSTKFKISLNSWMWERLWHPFSSSTKGDRFYRAVNDDPSCPGQHNLTIPRYESYTGGFFTLLFRPENFLISSFNLIKMRFYYNPTGDSFKVSDGASLYTHAFYWAISSARKISGF